MFVVQGFVMVGWAGESEIDAPAFRFAAAVVNSAVAGVVEMVHEGQVEFEAGCGIAAQSADDHIGQKMGVAGVNVAAGEDAYPGGCEG